MANPVSFLLGAKEQETQKKKKGYAKRADEPLDQKLYSIYLFQQ